MTIQVKMKLLMMIIKTKTQTKYHFVYCNEHFSTILNVFVFVLYCKSESLVWKNWFFCWFSHFLSSHSFWDFQRYLWTSYLFFKIRRDWWNCVSDVAQITQSSTSFMLELKFQAWKCWKKSLKFLNKFYSQRFVNCESRDCFLFESLIYLFFDRKWVITLHQFSKTLEKNPKVTSLFIRLRIVRSHPLFSLL